MVLSRIASNYVPANRTRNRTKRNENHEPPKTWPQFGEGVTYVSSTPARSTRKRASSQHSGERDRRRAKESAKKRLRTQPQILRKPQNAASTSTSSPPSAHAHERQPGVGHAAETATGTHALLAEGPHDVEMGDSPAPAAEETPVFNAWSLPRQLSRPPLREIEQEKLAAVDSELADVPVEFTQEFLELEGPDMFETLKRASVVGEYMVRNSPIPTLVRLRLQRPVSVLPTHALAVFTGPRNFGADLRTKVTITPIHSIIPAAFCSQWPVLPRCNPPPGGDEESGQNACIMVPVVPLRVPSAETFPIIMTYLYNQTPNELVNTLLEARALPVAAPDRPTHLITPPSLSPVPSLVSVSSIEEDEAKSPLSLHFEQVSAGLARFHATAPDKLLFKVRRVYGLWQNACSLGVCDQGLWSAIDTAWAILLRAVGILSNAGGPRLHLYEAVAR